MGNEFVYRFVIKVSYQMINGKLTWRIISQLSVNNIDKTKIELMLIFANMYNIPDN